MFDTGYRMFGAGARGWYREIIWGGRWEGGSGLGTHVHLWLIHVNVWQNQYNIVKQNKVKIKIKNKRNDLILLLMDWLDCISAGITLSHKFLLPYCHLWVCHLGFASLIREMCSIYLPAENVYQYLNCFQRLPGNSCELAAVLDGLFLKTESIHVMFIGKFKLPAYDSSIYIFWGFVIPCRVWKLFTSLWPRG